ncbi:MAG: hypothetical protein ABI597_11600 [Gammaproteobacteria bacterium]
MNRIIRLIQNYLIIGLPFVIICMVWSTLQPESGNLQNASYITQKIWAALGINIMLWFSTLIVYLFILVIAPKVREKTLRRLANLQERDEREQYITGKAARTAYISTMSLMIFFLFFSIFSLRVMETPKSATNKHKMSVSIGLQFSLLDETPVETSPEGKTLFVSKDIPLSKSAIILILLSWQLLSFNLAARKEQLKGMD